MTSQDNRERLRASPLNAVECGKWGSSKAEVDATLKKWELVVEQQRKKGLEISDLDASVEKWRLVLEEGKKKVWERIAVPEFAKELGLDPGALTYEERNTLASYDTYTFDIARKFGLNPLTLNREERKEINDLNPETIRYAQKLGLNEVLSIVVDGSA